MGVFFEDKNGSNALLPSSWLAGDHFAQQVPDGSVNNYVPIPYNSISGFSASARSVTKRHHSARNHAKKRKSSIATKKRKREDKVDRMKLFSSRVARKKNQSTRNENNSKSTKRRKKSRKAGGSSSNTTVDLIGMYIPPNRATFAPPMGAPQPMGAPKHSKIPPFTFSNVTATNPFRKQSIPAPIPTRGYKRMSEYPGPIPFGNPSIMQGTLATMYGSPPQNMPYPPPRPCANDQPTYPYVRFQPQVQVSGVYQA